MIAVAEIFSTRLSLANLYTQFARYHRRVGGTAISTLATHVCTLYFGASSGTWRTTYGKLYL